MGTPMTRGAYADSLNLAIEKVITMEWGQGKSVYPDIFNVKSTERKEVQRSYLSTLPYLALKTEGTAITYDSPEQGYKATWTPLHYALGAEITEEMMEDDDHDQIRSVAKNLPRSARATAEKLAFDVINTGFAVTTGPDGVYLFSASHPLVKSGGLQSNLLTAGDLSFATLSTAITTLGSMKDDAGLPVNPEGSILLVHPDNMLIAQQLLKSTQEPQSMDNSINPIRNMLDLKVSPFISDSDSWFIFPKKGDHEFDFYWRKKPRLRNGVDERSTLSVWHNLSMRCVANYGHYFPVLGNAGA